MQKTSKPKPTKFENYRPEKCPDCCSESLKVTTSETRDITEREKIIKTTTTRHTIDTCTCRECGRVNIVSDTDSIIPKSGSYGPDITTDVGAAYESDCLSKKYQTIVRGI